MRGVGCFGLDFTGVEIDPEVSVPLRGVGCFRSPAKQTKRKGVSVPLRGVGCFRALLHPVPYRRGVSVPLRGVGCFARSAATQTDDLVSVPLRGVGCFRLRYFIHAYLMCFRPLAGCGLFQWNGLMKTLKFIVSVPLRGVGCFPIVCGIVVMKKPFPSPCGVWVVSSRRGVK